MSNATSRIQRTFSLTILPLAFLLLNCDKADDGDKNSEQANTVLAFPPGGECPKPGSACFVPGYSDSCFLEGEPYECECVPTGLYNAHLWLCEYQGGGGPAGAGGGPGGSGGSGGGPGGSCLGPNGELFCGTGSPDGCFCDDACEQFGDCCPDKFAFCGFGGSGGSGGAAGSGGAGGGFGSCIGDKGELFCGGASDDGCFCDDGCEQFGDCCPDKFIFCGGSGGQGGSGGAGGGVGSCVGPKGEIFCGTGSPDGCFCDEICEQAGDCCPDKFLVCGGSGGAGGQGGSAGSGGGGLCAEGINACAGNEKCARVIECVLECGQAGVSTIEALNTCLATVGASIDDVADFLGTLLNCRQGPCAAECSTPDPGDPGAVCPPDPASLGGIPACGSGAEQISSCFACFCTT